MMKNIYRILFFFNKLIHLLIRKKGNLLFLVTTKPWGGNSKAICDVASLSPRVKKIVILNMGTTDNSTIAAQYSNSDVQVIVSDFNIGYHVLTCDILFTHEYSKRSLPHFSVSLWHGIPIKKIGRIKRPIRREIKWPFITKYRRKLTTYNRNHLHDRTIASSMIDSIVMGTAIDVNIANIYRSGLPRNDWLCKNIALPNDLKEAEERLFDLCKGRKLCLYAPTFRDEERNWCPMSPSDVRDFGVALYDRGYILGIRPHITVPNEFYDYGPNILDLSSGQFHEIQVILRNCDLLVTDYSSCSLDYMLTEKPIISYCPDLETYSCGLIYDFEAVFPGGIARTHEELITYIIDIINGGVKREEVLTKQKSVLRFFHENEPGNISQTLLDRILDDRERFLG